MESADLEEQLRIYARDKEDSGSAYALEALKRRVPEDFQLVVDEADRRTGEIVGASPALIGDGPHESWYVPQPSIEQRWRHYKEQLANSSLGQAGLDRVDATSNQIVERLPNPSSKNLATRGLVLGHVQSGKTTNFLAVAAKALDHQYNVVIVLAGIHNSLRRQTQERAEQALVHNPELWWRGTATGEFRSDGNSLTSHLAGPGRRALLVVKKQKLVLKRLADWLYDSDDVQRRKLKILVIDDEADQAGLDVSEGPERAGIHEQLMRILELEPENLEEGEREFRCAYLAYTATPYANVLTSQAENGLYPRDFIYPLEKPDRYVGSDELFGENQVGSPVRIIQGDQPHEGLREAVCWFVLATAARAALEGSVEKFHSSMMIHVASATVEQNAYKPVVQTFLQELREEFRSTPDVMQDFYSRVLEEVDPQGSGPEGSAEKFATWTALAPHVEPVLDRLISGTPSSEPFKEDGKELLAKSGVIVDNSTVPDIDRLTYSKIADGQPSVTVIAIGGNTLSRGLTLEGLVCSYFERQSRNYDTLMQMGRWFGFRNGYRHLTRLWTTQQLLHWFRELNVVENEFRSELEWMRANGLRPADYGPRIRLSPHLNITRASVISSVKLANSFGDHIIDPSMLDMDELAHNKELCLSLAMQMKEPLPGTDERIFTNVPGATVRTFLEKFRFHKDDPRINKEGLFRYLDEVNRKQPEQLANWNIMFKSNQRSGTETFDFSGNVGEVQTIERSKIKDLPDAYIGSLIDSDDHRSDFKKARPVDRQAKYRGQDEPPLLVVYAIDRKSEGRGGKDRVPLKATSPPLSVSVTLPRNETYVEYVKPRLQNEEDYEVPDLGEFASE